MLYLWIEEKIEEAHEAHVQNKENINAHVEILENKLGKYDDNNGTH
jgi:hypothetical protein